MHELADGVVRSNVGVDAIELRVRGRLEDSSVVLARTGQRFPVAGAPERATRPWLRFRVEGYGEGEQVRLVWLGEAADPAAFDAAPPGR